MFQTTSCRLKFATDWHNRIRRSAGNEFQKDGGSIETD